MFFFALARNKEKPRQRLRKVASYPDLRCDDAGVARMRALGGACILAYPVGIMVPPALRTSAPGLCGMTQVHAMTSVRVP